MNDLFLAKMSNESPSKKLREDWNAYVSWLDKKGMKGKPELDKGGLGFKMIEQYRKENPSTTVSKDSIKSIQEEFQKYREWSLAQVKAGKAQLTQGASPENYMKSLSIIDGIPGQRTTSFQFPTSYLTTIDNGVNLGTVNTGYAMDKK